MHACAIMSVCLCMCIRVLLMHIYKTTLCIVVLLINVVLLVVKRVDILCQTNVFKSNVTNKVHNVVSPNTHMDCGTDNIIYLVSFKKCGVQYVGETSQTLRKWLNNHRNRLKQLCGIYLYQHFNSDRHTIDDLNIMPIEKVTLTHTDK